jgi:hypothetical protein
MPITGTFLADFSAFKTAVGQAEITLKGLETGAGNVSKSINRIADSFSGRKVVQEAEMATAAVLEMGGAAVLTEKEQARLNATLTEAIAKYRAIGKEAPADMVALAEATDKAAASTAGFASGVKAAIPSMQGFLGQVQAMALGYVSGALAIEGLRKAGDAALEFVKSSIEAFSKAEAAQKRLETALHAQGDASTATAKQLSDLASAYQEVTVHSHEAIKETEALLIQVGGVLPSEMDKALAATTDLAAGLGIDLRAATMMVGKAFEDNFGALKKAGVTIDATKASAEGMTYVLDQIHKRFGGQAQNEAHSYAGQIQQLANAYDDLKESIGGLLLSGGFGATAIALAKAEVTKLKGEIDAVVLTAKLLGSVPGPLGAAFRALGLTLADVGRHAKEFGQDIALDDPDTSGIAKYGAALEAAKAKLAALEPSVRANLNAAIALNTPIAELEKSFHLTAGEIELYKKQLEAAKTAHEQAAEAAKKHEKAVEEFHGMMTKAAAEGLTQFLGKIHEATLTIPAHIIALNAARQSTKDLSDEVYQSVLSMRAQGLSADEITKRLIAGKAATEDDRLAIERLVTGLDAAGKAFDKLQEPIGRLLAGLPQLKLHLDAMTVATMAVDASQQQLAPDVKAAMEYMTSHGLTVDEATKRLVKYGTITQATADAIKDQTREAVTLDKALGDLAQSFALLAQIGGGAFDGIAKDLGSMVAALHVANSSVAAMDALFKDFTGKSLTAGQKQYAQVAVVGAVTGAQVAQLTGTRNRGVGAAEGALGGAAAGAAAGAPAGGPTLGWSIVIGAAAGAIGGYFAARKAAKEYEQANKDATASIGDMEKQLVSQYGRLEDIDRMGKQVGVDLAGAWGAQGVEGLQKFQALTDEFQKKLGQLNAAVQKFGLTWRDMTATKGLEAVNADAEALGETLHTLYTAGYDWGKVMQKAAGDVLAALSDIADAGGTIPESLQSGIVTLGQMTDISDANADALNKYVGHAMAAGQKIPASLEPVLQKLIEMGKLTDENARAMLGLGAESGPALADVKAAADRYGLTMDQLGGKMNQLDVNDKSKQIVADWNLLTGAGADVGSVMGGMKDKVQGIVDQALKFGAAIPESMKPMLQAMADAGELVDADGNKMTDLGKLSFAEDLTQKIGDLVDVLQKMFDGMSDGVEGSESDWRSWAKTAKDQSATAAGDVQKAFSGMNIKIPVSYDYQGNPLPGPNDYAAPGAPPGTPPGTPPPGAPPGTPAKPFKPYNSFDPSTWAAAGALITPAMVRRFAGGGAVGPWTPMGSDTVPAMLTPGERVLSVADTRAYDARFSPPPSQTTIIIQTLDGESLDAWLRRGTNARTVAEHVVPQLPAVVRRYGLDR